MSTVTSSRAGAKEWLLPFGLSVLFTVIIQGLSLSAILPAPVAVFIGAGWGVTIGLLATWIRNKARLSAWLEDGLVFLGVVAMAFLGAGGLTGILLISSAVDSSSIIANTPMELLVVPALLILGWREGKRRILIVVAVALFLILRAWSHLVFVSARLDFAETARSTTPLTAAERQQFYTDLHLDDSRWILNLIIFAVLLFAAYFSRVRELKATINHHPLSVGRA